MRKFFRFEKVSIILVFLLSLWLRFDHLDQFPQKGATHDEFAFAFLGQSLWQDHLPTAWSNLPVYLFPQDKYYLSANDTVYTIVRPYLDHPPLFGILSGGWALLHGEKEFWQVGLSTIRFISAILGSFSVVLLFKLAKDLYGFKTALVSSMVLATVPTYVISSRMSLAENLLIPITLTSLIVFEKLKKEENRYLVFFLGLLAGLAFLTKFVGIFVFLTLLVLFWVQPKLRKYLILFTPVAVLVGSLYFLYGFVLNPSLFWRVLTFQGSRQIGPMSFFNLFTTPLIVNKVFIDGWVYFGWFALVILLSRKEKDLSLSVPVLVYLFLFILTVDQNDPHGWYAYPFYPFLALASGKLVSEMIDRSSVLAIVFLFTAGLSAIELAYFNFFGFSPLLFRILLLLFFLPFLPCLFKIKRTELLLRPLLIFYLLIIFFLNVVSVLNFVHPA